MPRAKMAKLRQRWPVLAAAAVVLLLAAILLLWQTVGVSARPRVGSYREQRANGWWAWTPASRLLRIWTRPASRWASTSTWPGQLLRYWGVEAQIEGLGFDGLVDAVQAGRLDSAISALPYQPERTQDVAFSDAYFEAGLVLVTPAGSAAVASVDDLAGRRLAVEWGSEGDVQARLLRRRFPDLTLLPGDTPQAALLAVVEGQADAALVDHISALQFTASDARLAISPQVVVSDPYVIVLPRRAPVLQQKVGEALRALQADGTLDALTARWFGTPTR